MQAIWQESLQLSKGDELAFNQVALAVFHYQFENLPVYKAFANFARFDINQVKHFTQIPFLPISFFKSHVLCTAPDKINNETLHFESSGTTGMESSRHFVLNPAIYKESYLKTFQDFYGDPRQYIFACLLPSYLERGHSSLVYMCQGLIEASSNEKSGFYLYDFEALAQLLQSDVQDKKIFLIGVTYALIDFATAYPMTLKNTIVMETGGMKGRKEEWTKDQIHDFLKQKWQLCEVHSEYGMTELLSQAYARNAGIFETPPYLKVLVRNIQDPKQVQTKGHGLANIIDLSNVYSCSFIATDDLVEVLEDGRFRVLGRNDHAVLRGCSLMVV